MDIIEQNGFRYVEEGEGQPLVLLHGLFGALSNWETVTSYFKQKYRVIIPMLPIYEMPVREANLENLVAFVDEFMHFKGLKDVLLLGNSLGGHIALIYTLRRMDNITRLILTGSSGLFENTMGGSFPKRGNYEFVKERTGFTFYDPNIATKEMVDEVFEVTKSIPKCQRMVVIARSAQKHNMAKEIQQITIPTLLIWGLNDTITPPAVAHDFNRLIPNSELLFIDKCGHAPMIEHPDLFNRYLAEYLEKEIVL